MGNLYAKNLLRFADTETRHVCTYMIVVYSIDTYMYISIHTYMIIIIPICIVHRTLFIIIIFGSFQKCTFHAYPYMTFIYEYYYHHKNAYISYQLTVQLFVLLFHKTRKSVIKIQLHIRKFESFNIQYGHRGNN